jgi:hypothetical protein
VGGGLAGGLLVPGIHWVGAFPISILGGVLIFSEIVTWALVRTDMGRIELGNQLGIYGMELCKKSYSPNATAGSTDERLRLGFPGTRIGFVGRVGLVLDRLSCCR